MGKIHISLKNHVKGMNFFKESKKNCKFAKHRKKKKQSFHQKIGEKKEYTSMDHEKNTNFIKGSQGEKNMNFFKELMKNINIVKLRVKCKFNVS